MHDIPVALARSVKSVDVSRPVMIRTPCRPATNCCASLSSSTFCSVVAAADTASEVVFYKHDILVLSVGSTLHCQADSIGKHTYAQHSTAQHSTAQHDAA